MGRGRKASPTVLKLLRGNPGRRPLNKKEPQPKAAKHLKCPVYFGKIAKAEWARIVPELQRLKLLSVVDLKALEVYCMTYQEYVEAERVLAKEGPVYKTQTKDGELAYKVRPEKTISQKARQLLKGYLAEFGMTPSSRAGVSAIDGTEENDTIKDLLFGPRS